MALGLRRDAKVDLISHVPLFAGLSKRELRQVASIADEIDFRTGKTLIKEGTPGREFFILLEGRVEMSRSGQAFAQRGDGEFFGEIALVCNVPRVATVTTTAPTRALVVTDRDFRALVHRTPEIALKILHAVGQHIPTDTRRSC